MDPQTNEFEKLRALLALKRHEQPPPGYFSGFSRRVVSRIQAEERMVEASWWHRWIRPSLVGPALTCAYGIVVASLLIMGFNWAWHRDPQTADSSGNDHWSPGILQTPAPAPMEAAFPQTGSPLRLTETGTNPPGGLLVSNSPFSLPQWRQNLRVEPAGFQPDNR